MNEYDGLIEGIADKMAISKGDPETEDVWQSRVVYSICGRMAYASLWDIDDSGQGESGSVSIIHVRKRIFRTFNAYVDLYPGISELFGNIDDFVDKMIDLIIDCGLAYHKNYRLIPPIKSQAELKGITFTRGYPIGQAQCVSGIGTYNLSGVDGHVDDVKKMFRLSEKPLNKVWRETAGNAKWQEYVPKEGEQFLQMDEKLLRYGYWKDQVEDKTMSSIIRRGEKGNFLYYLYRRHRDFTEEAVLPLWMTEKGRYGLLSNACLSVHGRLPNICYYPNGNVVKVVASYLLPLDELQFFKQYSWPVSYYGSENFARFMTSNVFDAFRVVLESIGFQFEEGKPWVVQTMYTNTYEES